MVDRWFGSLHPVHVLFGVVLMLPVLSRADDRDGGWRAGTWDSTIYNRSERPRTVAVRVELVDSETRLPLRGVSVALTGWYVERRGGPARTENGAPYEPQDREFRMEAASGSDGVTVFALQWQKDYPWSQGKPKPITNRRGVVTYDSRTPWIKPVDDVEKVQRIEIRHPRYAYMEIPFDITHLLEFGQDPNSNSQPISLFEEFRNAWEREIRRPDVLYSVLDLGTGFTDFQNKASNRSVFFKKMRREDFGVVYTEPYNSYNPGAHPQSACGPYFVYLIEASLDRRSGQLEVNVRGDNAPRPRRDPHSRQNSSRSKRDARESTRAPRPKGGEGHGREARTNEGRQRKINEDRRAEERRKKAEHAETRRLERERAEKEANRSCAGA